MFRNATGEAITLYGRTKIILANTNTACPLKVSPGSSGVEVTPAFPPGGRLRITVSIFYAYTELTTYRGVLGGWSSFRGLIYQLSFKEVLCTICSVEVCFLVGSVLFLLGVSMSVSVLLGGFCGGSIAIYS